MMLTLSHPRYQASSFRTNTGRNVFLLKVFSYMYARTSFLLNIIFEMTQKRTGTGKHSALAMGP